MSFWNCVCQPQQAKYAIDELLRSLSRMANGETGYVEGVGGVPESGLNVSPFVVFMIFMGMVYTALTIQQRATQRQLASTAVPEKPGPDGGGGGGDAPPAPEMD